MRKIYIDVSMVVIGTNFTGIPRVVMEVAKRLYGNPRLQLVFLEYNQKQDDYEIIDTEGFIRFCKEKQGQRKALRTGRHIPLDGAERDAVFFDVDTVWKTRVRRSYLYPRLKEKGVKIIPFVHDIIGVTHPQFCPMDDMLNFLDFVGAVLAYGDEIVVTSHATEKAIHDLCGELGIPRKPVRLAPLGGDFKRQQNGSAISEEVKKIVGAGRYLLMVGTIDPRKNHKLLLDAYDLGLKQLGVHLVIAGHKGWEVDALIERMETHEDFGKGIFHIHAATDDEIDYLYEHCFALSFPSYVEGYGLPIMESMMRGVPVIAADTDINMEIGGQYAVYFRQDEPQELVNIVRKLLSNPEEYRSLRERIRAFTPPTWEETGEAIEQILSNENRDKS